MMHMTGVQASWKYTFFERNATDVPVFSLIVVSQVFRVFEPLIDERLFHSVAAHRGKIAVSHI